MTTSRKTSARNDRLPKCGRVVTAFPAIRGKRYQPGSIVGRISRAKKAGDKPEIMHLAELANARLRKAGFRVPADFVCPVPTQREISDLLVTQFAGGISNDFAIPYKAVLRLSFEYETQKLITLQSARRCNVAGAFEVENERAVRRKRIILVDDVATSGATLAAATRALIDAGAFYVVPVAIYCSPRRTRLVLNPKC